MAMVSLIAICELRCFRKKKKIATSNVVEQSWEKEQSNDLIPFSEISSILHFLHFFDASLSFLVVENEPLDTWDEEETILTPDPDDEVNKSCLWVKFLLLKDEKNFLKDVDIDDLEVAEGDVLPKASTKKKPLKVEENRSKKEHVNVVFIGHVGE